MTDYGLTPPSGNAASAADSELQDFLMAEKQKAQVNAQVSILMLIIQLDKSIE